MALAILQTIALPTELPRRDLTFTWKLASESNGLPRLRGVSAHLRDSRRLLSTRAPKRLPRIAGSGPGDHGSHTACSRSPSRDDPLRLRPNEHHERRSRPFSEPVTRHEQSRRNAMRTAPTRARSWSSTRATRRRAVQTRGAIARRTSRRETARYLRSHGGGNHGHGAGQVGSEPHTGECWKKK